jgi:hypothetical protein
MNLYVRTSLTAKELQNFPIRDTMSLGLSMIWLINELDSDFEEDHCDMISLLLKTTTFQATDPRDKIYGLLGLAGGEDRIIVPDYSKTVNQIRKELVKHHVDVDKNLRCLSGNRLAPEDPLFEAPS